MPCFLAAVVVVMFQFSCVCCVDIVLPHRLQYTLMLLLQFKKKCKRRIVLMQQTRPTKKN